MQIGELDRRITIQSYSASQDAYGEAIKTWSNLISLWANVNFKGGSTKDIAERVTATSKVIFTIRNYGSTVDTINESMRVKYKDRGVAKHYYINVINEIDGRDGFLELETEQKE
jgi:SPP1 family predicted phage head-tail adaptor|tara:strand:+ start:824 stop:1165 length:342 start_codon:yes stop_codon:yes gene_type:complete